MPSSYLSFFLFNSVCPIKQQISRIFLLFFLCSLLFVLWYSYCGKEAAFVQKKSCAILQKWNLEGASCGYQRIKMLNKSSLILIAVVLIGLTSHSAHGRTRLLQYSFALERIDILISPYCRPQVFHLRQFRLRRGVHRQPWVCGGRIQHLWRWRGWLLLHFEAGGARG